MTSKPGLTVVRPKRPSPVLVCAKCARKADDGRAIVKALKTEMATTAEHFGRKATKVVRTTCLGLCPKRAVTLASGPTLARGEMLVLSRVADVPAAVKRLLGVENGEA